MAYIATKATYIEEEEVKDENGKPVVDDNGNPVKRIKTDVDDVIFATGEVIVLIEEVNKGQHFDLSIEDKGSTYFAPTQIKIGDGMHSFRELNWLQTLDYNQVRNSIDKSVEEHTTNLSKAYTQFKQEVNTKIELQNQRISTFIDVDSKEILKNLIQDNYFSLSSNGVLSAFSGTSVPTVNNLKSFSIGNFNVFNNNATEQNGKACVVFGNNHSTFGFNNYSFGYNNSIAGAYILAHGFQNVINTSEKNKWTVCFGYKNQINNADSSIVIGEGNITEHANNVVIGTNNRTKGQNSVIFGQQNKGESYSTVFGSNSYAGTYSICCGQLCNSARVQTNSQLGKWSACFGRGCYTGGNCSFACGDSTEAIIDNSFACGIYNNGNNKIFSIGNGIDESERSNAFDIDTSGKATFYGDLEVKGQIVDNMQFINKTDFNKLKEQVNNIVITSTGDGNAALEVASARVGLNNINYSSLSDRLDADFEKCIDKSQLDSAIQQALIIDDLEISGGIINSNRGNSIYDDNGNKQGRLAMGSNNAASGTYSVAIGFQNTASGKYSTAIGDHNTSSYYYSIAMGYYNTASNPCSIAMGQSNTSSGAISVAMGDNNTASNHCSVAIGDNNTASNHCSVAMGHYNTASGEYSVSIGTGLIAVGDYQTALGKFNIDETEFDMRNLFVLGNGTDTSNRSNAMAVDWNGNLSLSGGITNLNSGNNLSGENGSHGLIAMGGGNTASAWYSAAIGAGNTVSGQYSVAMCAGNSVSGMKSVAMGQNNAVTGENSVAMGQGNAINVANQTVIGRYNMPDFIGEGMIQHAFIIGNGEDAHRSNAMTVDWNGNLNMNRDVVANAFGDSPISLVELSNRIGVVEEKLAKLATLE